MVLAVEVGFRKLRLDIGTGFVEAKLDYALSSAALETREYV